VAAQAALTAWALASLTVQRPSVSVMLTELPEAQSPSPMALPRLRLVVAQVAATPSSLVSQEPSAAAPMAASL
jgi:hypothetical protein